MIINFHLEAAKRRDRPGKLRTSPANLYETAPKPAARHTFAATENGSGWYHDAAMTDAATIRSHRDWD